MLGQRSHLVAVNVTGFVAIDTWPLLRTKVWLTAIYITSACKEEEWR